MLCLRPPQVFHRWVGVSTISPPIGLAYVAAAVRRAGYAVRAVDAMGEAPFRHTPVGDGFLQYGLSTAEILSRIGEQPADVLAVTAMFSHDWPQVRALLARIKDAFPSLRIVIGGEHPSAIPEVCLEQCPAIDVCVVGEGEATMVALLDAWRDRSSLEDVAGIVWRSGHDVVRRNAPRERIRDLSGILPPAWDLFPIERYLESRLAYGVNLGRTMPMLATRGCPFECTFCSNPSMWTTRWQPRPVADVIAEIAQYRDRYQATNFDFYDLTAVIRRDWIIEFCDEILQRGWRITWQMPAGTRSEALDREVLERMQRSGHRHIVYAPETGSARTLAATKKKVNLERMEASIRDAVRLDLDVKLNMIMGLPGETRADLAATVAFLMRMAWMGVTDAFIAAFMPYPGSSEFRRMRDAGQIGPLDDRYFSSLAGIPNLFAAQSFAPAISSRALVRWRIAGSLAFYGVSWLRRPWRLLRTIVNVARRRESSRLDMALVQLRDRLFGAAHS